VTQEIIEMAQECGLIGMRPHLDGIYSEALVAFAKLVAERALAEHAMREVQRLGQEIEQESFEDLAPALFAFAQISPADDGFSDTIDRIETWLREHFSTPPQRTEEKNQ
jgi:hypothetical protein